MSVQKELRSGLIITAISKYSNIFFELLITILLARLLTPEEFGIVAVILVFTMLFNLLGEIGIGTAIVQNKELQNTQIQSIFNYTILIAIVTAVGFVLISYPIAGFYENVEYIKIGRLLACAILFYILNVVPQAILRKTKQFLKLEGVILLVNIITGVLAIFLAYYGYGYYALIYREILKAFFLFLINIFNIKFVPSRSLKIDGLRLIFNYSLFQFLFNIVNYISRNLASLLISKYMGAANLGFYDRAYRLMLYPAQTLTFVITPVLHPVLAEYQNEPETIHSHYTKILELLAFIGVPLSLFLFSSAEEVILIMYGDQWTPSIPIFKILALTIWSQMTLASTGAIFQALGKTNLLFISGFISAIITTLGVLFGVFSKDLELIGYGILVAYTLNFFQGFYLLFSVGFNKSIFHFLLFFKLGFLSTIILLIGLIIVEYIAIDNIYYSVILKGTLLLLSMYLGAFFFKKNFIEYLNKKLKIILPK
ncbi:MAG: lipopolysaccharide biosynthesis protein [Maribacter sp.]